MAPTSSLFRPTWSALAALPGHMHKNLMNLAAQKGAGLGAGRGRGEGARRGDSAAEAATTTDRQPPAPPRPAVQLTTPQIKKF